MQEPGVSSLVSVRMNGETVDGADEPRKVRGAAASSAAASSAAG
jgi:hypothetical protein